MSSQDADLIRRILIRAAGTIIAGLTIQSVTLIWWAGGMEARMCAAEKAVDLLNNRVLAVEIDR